MMMHPVTGTVWLIYTLIALLAPAAASAADCDVLASGHRGSDDYIASYSGGCKNGRAEGQGVAKWVQRYSPDSAPIVWQGQFVDGIYLAEPEIRGARRLDRQWVLFDLGPLAGPGHTGRLWAQSSIDNDPASACHPLKLHVSTRGPLHEDALARRWLDAAYQHWRRICGAKKTSIGPVNPLQVLLHEGHNWESQAQRDWPKAAVQASIRQGTSTAQTTVDWAFYSNHLANARAAAQRQQAWDAKLNAESQVTEKRLRDVARRTGAKRFVSLEIMQQNPFRFDDEIVLTDLRLDKAHTPTEAAVRATTGNGRGLLHGDIAQWDASSRIAAVRVNGRSSAADTEGMLLLELIGSQTCERADCDDFLWIQDQRTREKVF